MDVPVLIVAALAVMPAAAQDTTVIRAGLAIDRNTTLRRGAYRIQSANIEAPVITIRGSNIDLDLSGVELIGSPDSALPGNCGLPAGITDDRPAAFPVGLTPVIFSSRCDLRIGARHADSSAHRPRGQKRPGIAR